MSASEIWPRGNGVVRQDKYHGSAKLAPHLHKHLNYLRQYRSRTYTEQLGVHITEPHKVCFFKQESEMTPYIQFNTGKRTKANNEFQKGLIGVQRIHNM